MRRLSELRTLYRRWTWWRKSSTPTQCRVYLADIIRVPDFAGGMENWGLVIYKNNVLLFNEETSSANDKKRVAEGIRSKLS
jgi:aminopeptidase N